MGNKIENSNANNKRSNKISTYKRKNIELCKQITEYIKKTKPDEETTNHLLKLTEKLMKCAHISLYRMEQKSVKYINSHTCKNRICNVCNFKRLKQIRRKYLKFFQSNEVIVMMRKINYVKTKKKGLVAKISAIQKPLTINNAGLNNWRSGDVYSKNTHVFYLNIAYRSTVDENKNNSPKESEAWQAVTIDQALKEIYKYNLNYFYEGVREYDLMHLTLTVRHEKETGWNGEIFYFQQFGSLLKQLRDLPFWKELVYGGEFGIEVTNHDGRVLTGVDGKPYTRPDTGLHIHVHSLIMVKKGLQNRNILYREIMLAWNQLSVNEKSAYRVLDAESIKKGNKLFTDDDVKQLNPKGATLIGLSNIYYHVMDTDKKKMKQKFLNQVDFKNKGEGFCRAILETIKYHFEPVCFSKDKERFDIDLIAKIIPKIHKLRFHDRFGCLYGVNELSIKENKPEDLMAELKENAEENGEEGAEFYIIPAQRIIHDWTHDNKIVIPEHVRSKAIKLDVSTTPAAIMRMTDMVRVTSTGKSIDYLEAEKKAKQEFKKQQA